MMKVRMLVLVVLLAAMYGGRPAMGADADVTIQHSAFAPSVIDIDEGDTITWTNLDSIGHTVTSSSGLFGSPLLFENQTFAFTFAQPGIYSYFCQPHPWMEGEVRVAGEGEPPTWPPNNVQARPGGALGQVQVTWTPPVLDGGSPVTSYRVCRNEDDEEPACTVVSGTSFTDTNVPLLTTRHYRVSAINFFGEGPQSQPVCSKPFPWLATLGC